MLLLVHISTLSVKLPRLISWDIYNVRHEQILTYKPCCSLAVRVVEVWFLH